MSAVVALAIGGCASSTSIDHGRQPRSVDAQHNSRHPMTVQVTLDQTTARAGHSITGIAIVTNATSHPLTIEGCNGDWLQVGLSSDKVGYRAVWNQCLTYPSTSLPVGTTRIPIKVLTTYAQCSQDPGAATADTPACIRDQHGFAMPPLPPGRYVTTAVMLHPKGVHIPTPSPVHVTITR